MDTLDLLRDEISSINDDMLKLFIQRMEISASISQYKKERGLPTLDRKREEAILQKVADDTPEEFRNYALDFFRKMMDLSKDYQESLKGLY
ncbi:MAG: chorismate mutase [Oscillospiraceae bacterium]